MRKLFALFVSVGLILLNLTNVQAIEANKQELELDAESVILMDATSGTVLYQKNGFQQMQPASITKVMTVYLATQKGNLDQQLSVSKTAVDSIDRNSTHIWLDYDEQLTLRDASYAALLQSANDAANVVAEAIGGTQESFAEMMNTAAVEAGAMGTHFVNAHGLPDENHYTTAYDMALITKMALINKDFRTIFNSYNYTMPATNKQKDERIFATGNDMLKKGKYAYEYATGGKIGWTEDAGYTMVGTAKKGDLELIVVLMNNTSKDARYADAQKLFDYGFENYKTATISAGTQAPQTFQVMKGKQVAADVTFKMENDFKVLLDSDTIEELVKVEYEIRNQDNPDTVEGYAVLTLSGTKIGEQKMNAEIVKYDLSFKATTLPKIMNVVDTVCALITLACLGLIGYAWLIKKTKKAKAR